MDPTIKAALLCDYALIGKDEKLSVIGIFSSINMQTLPGTHPRFFVVIVVGLDRGPHALQLGVVDPVGNAILPNRLEIGVQVEIPGADSNLIVDFNNLPFERTGIYQVQLFYEGRLVHAIPLNVQAMSSGHPPAFAS